MKIRDLIYDIAEPNEAQNFSKTGFFYQDRHEKNTRWKGTNTHEQSGLVILKHSQYGFTKYERKDWNESYANSIHRRGALFLDFDSKKDIALALKEGQEAVQTFIKIGVPKSAIHTCASGSKGVGIYVDSRIFGERSLQGHQLIPMIHGTLVKKLFSDFKTLDMSIYKGLKKGRLVRTINAQRENGKYRALIDTQDFLKLTVNELNSAINSPGKKLIYDPNVEKIAQLESLFNDCLTACESETPKTKAPRQLKASPITLTSKTTIGTSDAELPKCISTFNNITNLNLNSEIRFNDLSYLAASTVRTLSDADGASELKRFLENAPSETYPTYENKKNHFQSQLTKVREGTYKGPFCKAIRKAFQRCPCAGCKYLASEYSLLGRRYHISKDGISYEKITREGISYIPISNAVAFLRAVRTIYGPNAQASDSQFVFDLIADNKHYTLILPSDAITSNDLIEKAVTLQTDGKVTFNSAEKKPAVQMLQLALVNEPFLGAEKQFNKIGFISNFNTYIYTNCVVSNGSIAFQNGDVVDHGEGKNKFLRWQNIPLEKVSISLKRQIELMLEIHDDKIVLPVFAFAFLPIIAVLVNHGTRFYLLIMGMTGDSKSTVCKSVGSLWGDSWGLGKFLSASATPNSLEVESAKFGYALINLDDVKEANIHDMPGFRRFIQNYADGTPRRRLRSDGTPINSEPITGFILLSGEDHFAGGEASILGRGLELTIATVNKNVSAYCELEQNSLDVNGTLPHFIAYLQRQDTGENKKKFQETVLQYNNGIRQGENKERIVTSLGLLDFSMQCFLSWARQELMWQPEFCNDLYSRTKDALVTVGQEQAKKASEITPANLFLNILADLFATGKVRLESAHSQDGSLRGNVIGRLFEDHVKTAHVYLIPNTAYVAVKEFCEKMNTPFDFSIKALALNLDRLGFLAEKNKGQKTKKRRFGGQNLEYWVVSKAALKMMDGTTGSEDDLPNDQAVNNQASFQLKDDDGKIDDDIRY